MEEFYITTKVNHFMKINSAPVMSLERSGQKYTSLESMQMVGGPMSKKPNQNQVSDAMQEDKRPGIEDFGVKVTARVNIDVCEGATGMGGDY